MFDTPPWLERLTDDQRRAVMYDGGPLLVLAGAGTGKTTTLTSRVAWLLASGVPADRVLLLTFTRRAAREMLTRTSALLGAGGLRSGRVRGGTFHSVAHSTLRAYASAVGLPEGFGVLDPSDAADVLDLVREEAGLAASARRFPRKGTLLDAYSRTVNAQQPLSEVLAEHLPWCAEWTAEIAGLFRGYVARKRALGLLDFDDLLLLWRALAADDRLGPRLAGSWDHVLVDEYQDVNALQVDLVRALRPGPAAGLTAVGDDAQAVYGFRAATALHVRTFPDTFPGTSVVVLERNHRSTQPVLDLANAVSDEMPDCWPRHLTARPDAVHGPRPELLVCHDESRQAAEVADRVLAHREGGTRLRDQAVLVRNAHHANALELELGRRGVPYTKYGGIRHLETAHVKDLLAAFRLADNRADDPAAFRVLQLLDGVGPAGARRLGAELAAGRPGDDLVPPHSRGAWTTLRKALDAVPGEAVAAHGERVLRALRPLVAARYDDAQVRIPDLERLVDSLGAARGVRSLASFATELTLESPVSSSEAGPPHLDEDYLVVSTIHSAKGLEWEVVHLISATDGNLPSDMSLTTPAGLAEERRLFYVAVTRARRALHLYAPLRYHLRPRGRDDAHALAPLSRFLTPAVLAAADRAEAVEPEAPPTAGPVAARVAVALDDLWR